MRWLATDEVSDAGGMVGDERVRALRYAAAHRAQFVDELAALVRFATVGAQPARRAQLEACARWLAGNLRAVGLERVAVVPTARHPIVYGQLSRRPGAPTLLFYGHYDVQPAEPLSAWRTPPFEARREGDFLYGRGAADDKGQLLTHLKAIECCVRAAGGPPVNVKVLLEGDEEVGSPTLRPFLRRNARRLATDAIIVSDTRMLAPERPTLVYGLRGQLSLEIVVEAAAGDLHAGNFGGAVPNAARVLAALVSTLHGPDGRVVVAGFHGRVRAIEARERAFMRRNGPNEREVAATARVSLGLGGTLPGEPGYTPYERTTIRPSIEVSGLEAGYTGAGPKAVIPARARARLDIRLVPDQDPTEVEELVRRHLQRRCPAGVRVTVLPLGGAAGVSIDRTHAALRAAAAAATVSFGAAPVWIRSGGTIGAVDALQTTLRAPAVLLGFALPDSNIHAPNERLHLPTFWKGIRTSIELMFRFAAAPRRRPAATR